MSEPKPNIRVTVTRDNLDDWPAYKELLHEGKIAFDSAGRLRYSHGAPVGVMLLVRISKDGTPVYRESADEWFDPESPAAEAFKWL